MKKLVTIIIIVTLFALAGKAVGNWIADSTASAQAAASYQDAQ